MDVALSRAVEAHLDRILGLNPEVLGQPENVHRARVALRRLRAAGWFYPPLGEARESLREIAVALGRVRDLDVFVEGLRRDTPPGDETAVAQLAIHRQRERDHLADELARLFDGGAIAALRDVRERFNGANPSTVRTRPIRQALRRLRRRARRARFGTAEDLHRLRIAAKRFRYTLELLAPERKREIELATRIQDALGSLRDDEAAVDLLLEELERGADAGLVARLIRIKLGRRGAHLARFRELLDDLPSAGELVRRMEEAPR